MGRHKVYPRSPKTLSKALREFEISIGYLAREQYRRDHANDPAEPRPMEIYWIHVYQLVDPRDGSVFYVGKGGPYRLGQHEKEADLGLMTPKCIRIREIWSAGLQVEFRTVGLFQTPDYDGKALRFESKLIKEGGGALTNNQPVGKTWRQLQHGRS